MVRKKAEKPLLKIKIHGTGFKPGRIPVPLLLKICGEAQTAVNRQAEALEGKRSLRPGPVIANVARECTLELFGLKKGSTTLNFARASEQGQLIESQSLSFEAVTGVAAALKAAFRKRNPVQIADVGVLDTLNNLGEAFEKGVSKIEWIVPAHNGTKRISVSFSPKLRTRIASGVQRPASDVSSTVEGTLELTEGRCRINPPVGAPISCAFEREQAEEVFEAMRKPVKVKMDAKTHKIENIEITSPPDTLGTFGFFAAKSIDQLIAEQKVRPVRNLAVFSGELSDDEVDDLITEIHQGREA